MSISGKGTTPHAGSAPSPPHQLPTPPPPPPPLRSHFPMPTLSSASTPAPDYEVDFDVSEDHHSSIDLHVSSASLLHSHYFGALLSDRWSPAPPPSRGGRRGGGSEAEGGEDRHEATKKGRGRGHSGREGGDEAAAEGRE
uniref:Uncharacterized protein n=1 Tax=Oryza glumipatula TaxID=40148 RepID=A0A0D9YAB0_9ORYZ